MSRVRLSLSHRAVEDSPSCLLRLRLALSSNWLTLFIGFEFLFFPSWKVFAFALAVAFFRSCRHGLSGCGFRLHPDGPDEAQQFAPHGGNDLALILARRGQPGVALVQAELRLPGDLFDLFRHPFLPLAQRRADGRPEPVAPGGFDGDASQVRVACLGNRPALLPLAAGVLAGHRAAVAHQLPRALKARDLAQLGHDRHCRDLRNAAQRLQAANHFLHPGRSQLHRLRESPAPDA